MCGIWGGGGREREREREKRETLNLCSKIGEEQSREDAEDGPPELLVNWQSHAWHIHSVTACFPPLLLLLLLLLPLLLLLSVHSRWSHSQDLRFLLEQERALGAMQCLRGQHTSSLADGEQREREREREREKRERERRIKRWERERMLVGVLLCNVSHSSNQVPDVLNDWLLLRSTNKQLRSEWRCLHSDIVVSDTCTCTCVHISM